MRQRVSGGQAGRQGKDAGVADQSCWAYKLKETISVHNTSVPKRQGSFRTKKKHKEDGIIPTAKGKTAKEAERLCSQSAKKRRLRVVLFWGKHTGLKCSWPCLIRNRPSRTQAGEQPPRHHSRGAIARTLTKTTFYFSFVLLNIFIACSPPGRCGAIVP